MQVLSAYAPGRVELLGNHTDYNEGYVLSAAIDRGVSVAGLRRDDGSIFLKSGAMTRTVEAQIERLAPLEADAWANYPLGVAHVLKQEGLPVGGFELEIASDLPAGAGLSSSAALEVATALLLGKLYDFQLDPMRLASLCRRAENEFVGVSCGLLDQVSSVFGEAGRIVFLDCRAESVETEPLPEGLAFLITHSGVKHSLVGGEYNERRAQCFEAAEKLGVRALRDVTSDGLSAADLPPLAARRAAHVVGENERVLRGIELLRAGDAAGFGALMFDSHESSRVNFENSTQELDTLVALAREEPGLLGSRLTGGGFGGATVSLVHVAQAEEMAARITAKYKERTGHTCETHLCQAAAGAR